MFQSKMLLRFFSYYTSNSIFLNPPVGRIIYIHFAPPPPFCFCRRRHCRRHCRQHCRRQWALQQFSVSFFASPPPKKNTSGEGRNKILKSPLVAAMVATAKTKKGRGVGGGPNKIISALWIRQWKKISVLLSNSGERFCISCVQDFF